MVREQPITTHRGPKHTEGEQHPRRRQNLVLFWPPPSAGFPLPRYPPPPADRIEQYPPVQTCRAPCGLRSAPATHTGTPTLHRIQIRRDANSVLKSDTPGSHISCVSPPTAEGISVENSAWAGTFFFGACVSAFPAVRLMEIVPLSWRCNGRRDL